MLATLVDSAPTGDDWMHEIKYDGYRMLARIEHGDARIYLAQRQGLDGGVAADRRRRSATCQVDAGVDRRRGRRRRRQGPHQLPGAAERAVRSAADAHHATSSSTCSTQTATICAASRLIERKQLLRALVGTSDRDSALQRRRARFGRRILRAGVQVEARGRGLQARDFAVSRRHAHARLGQGQVRAASGNGDRRLHRSARQPHRIRRAAARRLRRTASCATRARSAPDSTTRRWPSCARSLGKLEQKQAGRSSIRRAASRRRARTGSSRNSSPKSRSPNGATTARCAIRRSRACAKTRRRPRSCARQAAPARAASAAAAQTRNALRAQAPCGAGALRTTSARRGDLPTRSPGSAHLASRQAALSRGEAHQARSRASTTKQVADWILPHLRNRPLALVRCPDGWSKQCFYPEARRQERQRRGRRASRCPRATARRPTSRPIRSPALVGLVQWGVLELHPWGSRRRSSIGPIG